MRTRRLVLGVALFAACGAILLLMNRFSSFLFEPTPDGPSTTATPTGTPWVVNIYDPANGRQSGKLVAREYTALPDGTADCRGVTFDLTGTDYGDVTLRADKALLKVEEISKGVSGNVSLEGNVTINAVKGSEGLASGQFERLAYNAATKDVKAEGPFEVSWGKGFRLSGIDLTGNVGTMRFTIPREVTLVVKASEAASAKAAESGAAMPTEIAVHAGGPVEFDGVESRVKFTGGVTASAEELAAKGETLEVLFTQGQTKAGEAPAGWDARALTVAGGAEIKRGLIHVSGDLVDWQAEGGRVVVEGKPARLEDGSSLIEAPRVAASLDVTQKVTSVDARGPGRAEVTIGTAISDVLAQKMGSAQPDAAAQTQAPKALATWSEYLRFSSAEKLLTMSGGVDLVQGDVRSKADKMSLTLTEGEPQGAPAAGAASALKQDVAAFTANGNVTFADATRTLQADSAVYNRNTDLLTLEGAPVTMTLPGGDFSAGFVTWAPAKRILNAERNCRLKLAGVENPAALGGGKTDLAVASTRMTGNLGNDALSATFDGAVKVDIGEDSLTCARLKLDGAPLESQKLLGGEQAAQAGEKPGGGNLQLAGEGKVEFRRGEMSARAEKFLLVEAKKTLTLDPAKGERVELRYGETATIWGDNLRGDGETGEVTVDKPQVIVTADGALMGLTGADRDKPEKVATTPTKAYINADRMILRRTAEEQATLIFDGNVKVASRSADAVTEDTVTAGTLAFDIVNVEPATATPAASGGRAKTSVASARAAGGVTLRISGKDLIIEGSGDSFDWDKKANAGRLLGSPASVWNDEGSSAKADEIIYDFTTGMPSMVRGRGGNILLVSRKKAPAEAAEGAPAGQ